MWERRYLDAKLPEILNSGELKNIYSELKWRADKCPSNNKILKFIFNLLPDYLSYPQATWFRKWDDCDGFALLATKLLRMIGINAYLLSVSWKYSGHAVCCWWQDGQFCYVDNKSKGTIRTVGSLKELVLSVAGKNKVVAWSLEDEKGNVNKVGRKI